MPFQEYGAYGLPDRFLLGAIDSKPFEHLVTDIDQIDGYFILDTRRGKRTQFQAYVALVHRARELGMSSPHGKQSRVPGIASAATLTRNVLCAD